MVETDPQAEMLGHIDLPVLLIAEECVVFANRAAITVLGGHIAGENIRLAIRHPAALALLASGKAGEARIPDLSVKGSIWNLSCQQLSDGRWMATLEDLSVRTSVARAHADFVANASHELRTPLSAILGYVETLGDARVDGDPATRRRFLDTIRREALRMEALVDDLMSLSRIEATRHEAPNGRIDVAALSREAAGEAKDRGRVLVEAPSAVFIEGDRGQIAQALRNLVDNAQKYGSAGTPVSIRIEATAGWVCISIHDEGEGIPPEHLPRLTERFYRVDPGRSRKAGGTGLGLAIVKHIVERHRGRLDISSREGGGTTVTIILPELSDECHRTVTAAS